MLQNLTLLVLCYVGVSCCLPTSSPSQSTETHSPTSPTVLSTLYTSVQPTEHTSPDISMATQSSGSTNTQSSSEGSTVSVLTTASPPDSYAVVIQECMGSVDLNDTVPHRVPETIRQQVCPDTCEPCSQLGGLFGRSVERTRVMVPEDVPSGSNYTYNPQCVEVTKACVCYLPLNHTC